jgi:hypothetical protein
MYPAGCCFLHDTHAVACFGVLGVSTFAVIASTCCERLWWFALSSSADVRFSFV